MSPIDRIKWTAAVAASDVSGNAVRVATILSVYAMEGATAWPSKKTIAAALHIDDAKLPGVFRALEHAGFVQRGNLDGPAGRMTFRWRLTLPPAISSPPAETSPPADSSGPPPAISASHPLPKRHPKDGREDGIQRGIYSAVSFALKGGGEWQLPDDLRDTLAAAFPCVDLDAELAKAAVWCATEPSRRKTASGMGRFLRGWLGRARTSETTPTEVRPQPNADALAYAAELEAEIRAKDTAHV
jgi:hypothetical protein